MALAFGGISAVSTSQTPTSVTVSGSDPVGFVFVVGDTAADNITAVTWNSVAMTKIAAVQSPGDRWMSVWFINNPASAATISFTGGSFWRSFSFYYTGADPTQPDSSNTNTATNSATIAVTTTVIKVDCWTIFCQKDNTGNVTYSTDVGLMRANTDAGGIAISDSNATVGTGAQTTTHTAGAGTPTHGAIGFSIKRLQLSSISSSISSSRSSSISSSPSSSISSSRSSSPSSSISTSPSPSLSSSSSISSSPSSSISSSISGSISSSLSTSISRSPSSSPSPSAPIGIILGRNNNTSVRMGEVTVPLRP